MASPSLSSLGTKMGDLARDLGNVKGQDVSRRRKDKDVTTAEMIESARQYLQPREPDDTTGDV